MISGIKKSIGICGIFLLASGVTLATAGSAGASTPRPQLKFVGVPTTTATTARPSRRRTEFPAPPPVLVARCALVLAKPGK